MVERAKRGLGWVALVHRWRLKVKCWIVQQVNDQITYRRALVRRLKREERQTTDREIRDLNRKNSIIFYKELKWFLPTGSCLWFIADELELRRIRRRGGPENENLFSDVTIRVGHSPLMAPRRRPGDTSSSSSDDDEAERRRFGVVDVIINKKRCLSDMKVWSRTEAKILWKS